MADYDLADEAGQVRAQNELFADSDTHAPSKPLVPAGASDEERAEAFGIPLAQLQAFEGTSRPPYVQTIDMGVECVCGHTRNWHGQEPPAPLGSGECERCECKEFEEPESIQGRLAHELAFALNNKRGLAETALEALEDHASEAKAQGHDIDPEVVRALDGFRGKGQWPA